jgi:hypothetical protein
MTRLSSDSESTTTTENDLVINGNILDEINTQVLERLLNELQQGIAIGAIGPDSDQFSTSTEHSEHSDTEQEAEDPIAITCQQSDDHCQVYGSYHSDCYSDDDVDQYTNCARPFEESVYEFALSSARRLNADDASHDENYDLRPKFAILKHKTEILTSNRENQSAPRTYPKTPDWFFNIPDTRSPFPNFESNLNDE